MATGGLLGRRLVIVVGQRSVAACASVVALALVLAACGDSNQHKASTDTKAGGASGVTVPASSSHTTVTAASTTSTSAHLAKRPKRKASSRSAERTKASGSSGVIARSSGNTLIFSGYGSQTLGTVAIRTLSELRWTSADGHFELFAGGAPLVAFTAHSGDLTASPKTYGQVRVVAPGSWTIHIAPISPPRDVTPSTPSPAGPASSGSTSRVRPMLFSGNGPENLGTVRISGPATLRWTHSGGGVFHLTYSGSSTAVESMAGSGSLEVPAATFRDVGVQTSGQWTIRIT